MLATVRCVVITGTYPVLKPNRLFFTCFLFSFILFFFSFCFNVILERQMQLGTQFLCYVVTPNINIAQCPGDKDYIHSWSPPWAGAPAPPPTLGPPTMPDAV